MTNLNSLLWCERYRTDHLFAQASSQYLESSMISEDIVSNRFRFRLHLQFSLERAVEYGVEEGIQSAAGCVSIARISETRGICKVWENCGSGKGGEFNRLLLSLQLQAQLREDGLSESD